MVLHAVVKRNGFSKLLRVISSEDAHFTGLSKKLSIVPGGLPQETERLENVSSDGFGLQELMLRHVSAGLNTPDSWRA